MWLVRCCSRLSVVKFPDLVMFTTPVKWILLQSCDAFTTFTDQICDQKLAQKRSQNHIEFVCRLQYWNPVGIRVSRSSTGFNVILLTTYQMTSQTKSDTVWVPKVLFYYREIVVKNFFELFPTQHLVTGNTWIPVLLLLTWFPTGFQYWILDRIRHSTVFGHKFEMRKLWGYIMIVNKHNDTWVVKTTKTVDFTTNNRLSSSDIPLCSIQLLVRRNVGQCDTTNLTCLVLL